MNRTPSITPLEGYQTAPNASGLPDSGLVPSGDTGAQSGSQSLSVPLGIQEPESKKTTLEELKALQGKKLGPEFTPQISPELGSPIIGSQVGNTDTPFFANTITDNALEVVKGIGSGIEEFVADTYDIADFITADGLPDWDRSNPWIKVDTGLGKLVAGITDFGIGMIPINIGLGIASKGLKTFELGSKLVGSLSNAGKVGKILQSAGKGALFDLAYRLGEAGTISQVIEGTPLANPVTRYLAGDIDDSTFERTIKGTVEGMLSSVAFDASIAGIKRLMSGTVAETVIAAGLRDKVFNDTSRKVLREQRDIMFNRVMRGEITEDQGEALAQEIATSKAREAAKDIGTDRIKTALEYEKQAKQIVQEPITLKGSIPIVIQPNDQKYRAFQSIINTTDNESLTEGVLREIGVRPTPKIEVANVLNQNTIKRLEVDVKGADPLVDEIERLIDNKLIGSRIVGDEVTVRGKLNFDRLIGSDSWSVATRALQYEIGKYTDEALELLSDGDKQRLFTVVLDKFNNRLGLNEVQSKKVLDSITENISVGDTGYNQYVKSLMTYTYMSKNFTDGIFEKLNKTDLSKLNEEELARLIRSIEEAVVFRNRIAEGLSLENTKVNRLTLRKNESVLFGRTPLPKGFSEQEQEITKNIEKLEKELLELSNTDRSLRLQQLDPNTDNKIIEQLEQVERNISDKQKVISGLRDNRTQLNYSRELLALADDARELGIVPSYAKLQSVFEDYNKAGNRLKEIQTAVENGGLFNDKLTDAIRTAREEVSKISERLLETEKDILEEQITKRIELIGEDISSVVAKKQLVPTPLLSEQDSLIELQSRFKSARQLDQLSREAVNGFREELGDFISPKRSYANLFQEYKKSGIDKDELIKRLGDLQMIARNLDIDKFEQYMYKEVKDLGFFRKLVNGFNSMRINNLLASPLTIARIGINNTAASVFDYTSTLLGTIPQLATDRSSAVQTLRFMMGQALGFIDALGNKEAWKAILSGKSKLIGDLTGYAEERGAETLTELARQRGSRLLTGANSVIEDISTLGGLTRGAITASDEAFKQMSYRAEMFGKLYSKALETPGTTFKQAKAMAEHRFDTLISQGEAITYKNLYNRGKELAQKSWTESGLPRDEKAIEIAAQKYVQERLPFEESKFILESSAIAINNARRITASQEPSNVIKAVKEFSYRVPLLRVVYPFLNGPMNAFSNAFDVITSPLSGGRVLYKWLKANKELMELDIGEGIPAWRARLLEHNNRTMRELVSTHPELRAKAMGRIMATAAFGGTTALLAANAYTGKEGWAIIGNGPTDPDMRKAMESRGLRPNSLVRRLPDGTIESFNYSAFEPIATVLNLVADITAHRYISNDDESDSLVAATWTGLQNLADKSVLSALEDSSKAIASTDRSAGEFLLNLVGTIVPLGSISNSINRNLNDNQQETRRIFDSEEDGSGLVALKNLGIAVREKLPWSLSSKGPKYNTFGEKIDPLALRNDKDITFWLRGIFNPITSDKEVSDPVLDELIKTNSSLGLPKTKVVNNKRINLLDPKFIKNDKQVTLYDEWNQLLSQTQLGTRSRYLKGALSDEISKNEYKNLGSLPDGRRLQREYLQKVYNQYRDSAWGQLLKNRPELANYIGATK